MPTGNFNAINKVIFANSYFFNVEFVLPVPTDPLQQHFFLYNCKSKLWTKCYPCNLEQADKVELAH